MLFQIVYTELIYILLIKDEKIAILENALKQQKNLTDLKEREIELQQNLLQLKQQEISILKIEIERKK